MDLNELSKEVHQNAVDHGWWEEERTFGEIIALCHSELSEALEEYRKGNGLTYVYCGECNCECEYFDDTCARAVNKRKPEGIPVELADCIIRILDFCGKENLNVDLINIMTLPLKFRPKSNHFGDWINYFHATLSMSVIEESTLYLDGCIREIMDYCKKEKIDIEEAIKIKHEYNKTRPYRHGGKKI